MKKSVRAGFALVCLVAALLALRGSDAPGLPTIVRAEDTGATDSRSQALEFLRAGNRRFASAHAEHPHEDLARVRELSRGQHPRAAVLACADSRCAPELVFDQGLGDIFTVRVVGEVLDSSVVASLEYAAEHLDVPLIVVLGHTDCGAVKAALRVHGKPRELVDLGPNLERVVERIEPVLANVHEGASDDVERLTAAVRANTRLVVRELRQQSEPLRERVREGRLRIVPAIYDVSGGTLSVLDADSE